MELLMPKSLRDAVVGAPIQVNHAVLKCALQIRMRLYPLDLHAQAFAEFNPFALLTGKLRGREDFCRREHSFQIAIAREFRLCYISVGRCADGRKTEGFI